VPEPNVAPHLVIDAKPVIELSPAELATVNDQLKNRDTRRPGGSAEPFTAARVIAVASGKGGVGKSTVTANLAVIAAQRGLRVGVLDADLHGFSLPKLLGITQRPTRLPENPAKLSIPQAHGVKVISIGMFTEPGKAVIWRGPVGHRALTQFLTDPNWGELDLLLVDLPPGTGDVALSIANLLPAAEVLLVTTPQLATAEVAARAGTMAQHTHQKVIGVVENMAWLAALGGQRLELFGSGGGAQIAESLTNQLGYPVNLLAQIPMDPQVPTKADHGQPIALVAPKSAVVIALKDLADKLQLLTS